jgi:hypothetical protein
MNASRPEPATFPDVAVPFRATLIIISTANVAEAGV